MTGIVNVLLEVWHLFVDDGVFAAAIIVWLAIVWLAQDQATLSAGGATLLLFVGLAIILIVSAVVRSRPVRR